MLEIIKVNSCGCLFDPKKIPMCVVLVLAVFVNDFINFFLQFASLSPFFHFANLSRFGNGCCMEHLQGFEGLV